MVQFVVSLNLHRRHLDKSQSACCAVEALPMIEAERAEIQRLGKKVSVSERIASESTQRAIQAAEDLGAFLPQGGEPDSSRAKKSTELAGEMFGVGGRYVADAKKIKAEAPEDFEAMKAGQKKMPEVKRDMNRREYEKKVRELAPRRLPR